jgi:post-segregation antitoxin (ccd killing protein)
VELNVVTAKINTTVYLNPELLNLAKEMGLNISKTCENALKTAINKLQGNSTENNREQPLSSAKDDWWTSRDLNPGPPRCQRGDHARLIYSPKVSGF